MLIGFKRWKRREELVEQIEKAKEKRKKDQKSTLALDQWLLRIGVLTKEWLI